MAGRGMWKTVALTAVAALLGAAAAGAGVYLWEDRRLDDLRDRAQTAEDDRTRLESRVSELEDLVGQGEDPSATDPKGPSGSDEPSDSPGGEDEVQPRPLKTERVIAYVKRVTEDAGRYMIVADYADMLTGTEAVEAAKADGSPLLDDDGTLPNDYYLRNNNTKLRTLSVARDVQVQVVLGANPKTIALGLWHDMMPGGAGERRPEQASAPYWLTIKGGVVVRIEQQYLP